VKNAPANWDGRAVSPLTAGKMISRFGPQGTAGPAVFCHFVEKSSFMREIHPPQYCYGGPVCGSNPAFKIKNLLQKIKASSSNPIKGLLMKKIPNFFTGTFMGKHLEIR